MKKMFLEALVAAFTLSIVFSRINFNMAKAIGYSSSGTTVGGIISEDTTWMLESSPYIFVDTVTVAKGVTLIMEPGVSVDMDFWSLKVEGTLHAIGNETYRIKIKALEQQLDYQWRIYFTDNSTPWNEDTKTGCVIEYAEINFWCLPSGIHGGLPRISNNLIHFTGETVISTDGIISNNTITGNGYRAIYAVGNVSISFNIIDGSIGGMQTGIHVAESADSPTIIGNLIKNTYLGGYGDTSNSGGIVFSGGWKGYPYIANNTLINCRNGLGFPPYLTSEGLNRTTIVHNNIYCTVYAVEVGKEDPRITINLPYNWWGTTNTSLIDQKIYDQKDDRSLCLVNYTTFLTEPAYFPLDVTPPRILNITQQPQQGNVESFQNVSVMANITDDMTEINDAILFYIIDDGLTWFNITMNYNSTSGLYEATIPGQPFDTTVKYKIIAYDYVGNYKVGDNGGQYFVYTVIPEFPSATILPLLMIFSILVVIFAKKKLPRKPDI